MLFDLSSSKVYWKSWFVKCKENQKFGGYVKRSKCVREEREREGEREKERNKQTYERELHNGLDFNNRMSESLIGHCVELKLFSLTFKYTVATKICFSLF